MQLTYTNHYHTSIQCILDAGETLGDPVELEGPCVGYVKVDGTSSGYAEIREGVIDGSMTFDDPLDTPAVATTLAAQAEAQAAAATATASAENDEGRSSKRRKNAR